MSSWIKVSLESNKNELQLKLFDKQSNFQQTILQTWVFFKEKA